MNIKYNILLNIRENTVIFFNNKTCTIFRDNGEIITYENKVKTRHLYLQYKHKTCMENIYRNIDIEDSFFNIIKANYRLGIDILKKNYL